MMVHLSFPPITDAAGRLHHHFEADTITGYLFARCSGNCPRFRTITHHLNLVTCKSCLRSIAADLNREGG